MTRRRNEPFPREWRDAAVTKALALSIEPMGPTDIAEAIGEPWCTRGFAGKTFANGSVISPVLKRIGAVKNLAGKYSLRAI